MNNTTARNPSTTSLQLYSNYCANQASDSNREVIAVAVFKDITTPAGALERHPIGYTIECLLRLAKSLPHGDPDDRAKHDPDAYTGISFDAQAILAAPGTYHGIMALVRELRPIIRQHYPAPRQEPQRLPILTAKFHVLNAGEAGELSRVNVTICRLAAPPQEVDEETGSYADTVMDLAEHNMGLPTGCAADVVHTDGMERLKNPHGMAIMSSPLTRRGVAALVAELCKLAEVYGLQIPPERYYVMRGWDDNGNGDARPLSRYSCYREVAGKWLLEIRKTHPRACLANFFTYLDDADDMATDQTGEPAELASKAVNLQQA